jgi:hypothetical protein
VISPNSAASSARWPAPGKLLGVVAAFEVGNVAATLLARLSNHLACLRDCGLVVAVPVGRRTRYELAGGRPAQRRGGRRGGQDLPRREDEGLMLR